MYINWQYKKIHFIVNTCISCLSLLILSLARTLKKNNWSVAWSHLRNTDLWVFNWYQYQLIWKTMFTLHEHWTNSILFHENNKLLQSILKNLLMARYKWFSALVCVTRVTVSVLFSVHFILSCIQDESIEFMKNFDFRFRWICMFRKAWTRFDDF